MFRTAFFGFDRHPSDRGGSWSSRRYRPFSSGCVCAQIYGPLPAYKRSFFAPLSLSLLTGLSFSRDGRIAFHTLAAWSGETLRSLIMRSRCKRCVLCIGSACGAMQGTRRPHTTSTHNTFHPPRPPHTNHRTRLIVAISSSNDVAKRSSSSHSYTIAIESDNTS